MLSNLTIIKYKKYEKKYNSLWIRQTRACAEHRGKVKVKFEEQKFRDNSFKC